MAKTAPKKQTRKRELEKMLASFERSAGRLRKENARIIDKWEATVEENRLLKDYLFAVVDHLPPVATIEIEQDGKSFGYELRRANFDASRYYVAEVVRWPHDPTPFADIFYLDSAMNYLANKSKKTEYSQFWFKEHLNPDFPSVIEKFVAETVERSTIEFESRELNRDR
jgi:hypothetical protein